MEKWENLYNDPRVTVRKAGAPDFGGRCVVYWMQRSQRARDNPALEKAVAVANALAKPVVVFFALRPSSVRANWRHFEFMVRGLQDVAEGLRFRRIGFVVRRPPGSGLGRFCAELRPCLVIGDENPMHEAERHKGKVARLLSVPLWTVDADVIVPSRLLAREHYAARTIRPRIRFHLPRFLAPVGNRPVKVHWKPVAGLVGLNLDDALLRGLAIDRMVAPVRVARGGSLAGVERLGEFLRDGLRGYARTRNRPELDGTSRLSPYLHFGHLGPHTVALAICRARAPREDREAFLEELIVRRELAVNFVRFNPHYERASSAEPWASKTLIEHGADKRPHLYSEAQLENGETHDPLWNAAQKQMVLSGWMHGYLRMYWAKKILEWSPSPAAAYQRAVRLNDRYELDGRDPNGYAGIAWAIVGKHDRAWGPQRPIFGKVRYMSYASTSRKFDSQAYIRKVECLERG
jgi:deoxyribodipyrimidine photo-lyase